MVKTINLTGSETEVKFNGKYPYFWVHNLGNSDVYMSVNPNIVPDSDGVILIPAGDGKCSGDVGQVDTLYFSGTGKVEVSPQFNAVCPFFKAAKGGDKSADAGLQLYFDYRKGVDGNTWTDSVSGQSINIATAPSEVDDFITVEWGTKLPNSFNLCEYTAYIICKCTSTADWKQAFFQAVGTKPYFNCETRYERFAFEGKDTDVKATDKYHVIALVFFNGTGIAYIDGVRKYKGNVFHSPIDDELRLGDFWNYKAVKLYTGIAHGNDIVVKNMQSLANEFNIEM